MLYVESIMRRILLCVTTLCVILVIGCSSNSDQIAKHVDKALEERLYGSDANSIIENILTHRVGGYPASVNSHVRGLLAKPLLAINANELPFTSGTANDGDNVIADWEAPKDLPRGLRQLLPRGYERPYPADRLGSCGYVVH